LRRRIVERILPLKTTGLSEKKSESTSSTKIIVSRGILPVRKS